MTKIFIFHGAYGNPEENWFPWLKSNLEKLNHEVIVPKFPTPENQSLESWSEVFKQYEFNEDTIFIGHSIAPAFILNILENLNHEIKAAFLVSGFIGSLNNPNFDEINKTFTEKEFNWDKIKQNCNKFFIYHSDNDPYVPIEKCNELSQLLNTAPKIIKDAGHFNKAAGYTEFDVLLDDINSIL